MSNHVCFLRSVLRKDKYCDDAQYPSNNHIYGNMEVCNAFFIAQEFFILFIYFHAWKKRVSSSYFLNRLNGWQTMMHCTPIHNMNKNIAECPRRTAAVPLCVSMMWWFCGHIYISRYYLKITLIFMIICVCMLLCSPETKLFCSHLHCLFD